VTPVPGYGEPFGPFPAAPPAPGNGTSAPTPAPATEWIVRGITDNWQDWLLAHPEGAICGGLAAPGAAAACFFGDCAAVAAGAETVAAPVTSAAPVVAAVVRRFGHAL